MFDFESTSLTCFTRLYILLVMPCPRSDLGGSTSKIACLCYRCVNSGGVGIDSPESPRPLGPRQIVWPVCAWVRSAENNGHGALSGPKSYPRSTDTHRRIVWPVCVRMLSVEVDSHAALFGPQRYPHSANAYLQMVDVLKYQSHSCCRLGDLQKRVRMFLRRLCEGKN